MTTAFARAGGNANAGDATSCGRSRNTLRSNYLVMQKARALFPVKTALHLSEITGYPTRTVEYWLSKNRLPAEAVGTLIRSEHGLQFVETLASGSAWWRRVLQALALADENQEQLREAIHEYRALGATIIRAEAALGLSGADESRAPSDAHGAARGRSDRPVDSARRGR